ncbi:hypothetical protein E1293_37745 [Actinomadura darangshiensis]|uniref:DivIVA domain-containing protein n=1 Tax=Actinomadura darangshiensis TaxID=705336 RepID=A0A4R5AD11_9ACTN|nr:hypothetical protein [Actinomadura darangshiensis]TDD67712.1 hypothetical protein E1293_37745 [Actinomadura darangshiensis]
MVVVVLVLAGVAVLGAVVALAMGRGGELAETHPDFPPLRLDGEGRPVLGPRGTYYRFPATIWGYQMQVTDEAVHRLTEALHERDDRVAELEHQLRELQRRAGGPGQVRPIGALHGIEEPGVPLRKEPDGGTREEHA